MKTIQLATLALGFAFSSCSKTEKPKPDATPTTKTEASDKEENPPAKTKEKNVAGELEVLKKHIGLFNLLAKNMDGAADDLQKVSPGPGVAASRNAAKLLWSIEADLKKMLEALESNPNANLRADYTVLIEKVKKTEASFRDIFLVQFKQDENNYSSWLKGLKYTVENLNSVIATNYSSGSEKSQDSGNQSDFRQQSGLHLPANDSEIPRFLNGINAGANTVAELVAKRALACQRAGEMGVSASLQMIHAELLGLGGQMKALQAIESLGSIAADKGRAAPIIAAHYALVAEQIDTLCSSIQIFGETHPKEKDFFGTTREAMLDASSYLKKRSKTLAK